MLASLYYLKIYAHVMLECKRSISKWHQGKFYLWTKGWVLQDLATPQDPYKWTTGMPAQRFHLKPHISAYDCMHHILR